MKLFSLCYSSIRSNDHESLLDEIESILAASVHFNKKHHITGVLYYFNGRFFQYIEGLESVIENLFDKIALDPRHQCITYYGTVPIKKRKFTAWSMKYVSKNSRVDCFFKNRGEIVLTSLALNSHNLSEFINELVLAETTKI